MEIFDTHCHYNLEPLASDWKLHHEHALAKMVTRSTIVGTSVETSELAARQAETDPNLYFSCGIHPNAEIDADPETEVSKLLPLLEKGKAVAVGETGLDYYRLKSKGEKRAANAATQKKLFSLQLELAAKFELPVIVHVRDQAERTSENAYTDTLEILKQHNCSRFVLHCVSGPIAYVAAAAELGGYIGIAGNVTYGTNSAYIKELLSVVKKEALLTETDAPYLSPVPFRGQTCEPAMIAETVKFLENELQLSATNLYKNACTFYGIQVQ